MSAALRYLDGVGTPSNDEASKQLGIQYMEDAAAMDNPCAIAFLASLRKSGLSDYVQHDENRAFLEFASLIDRRVPIAYLEAAECFEKGYGVDLKDMEKAFYLYDHAAQMGNVKAKYQLAQHVMKRYVDGP